MVMILYKDCDNADVCPEHPKSCDGQIPVDLDSEICLNEVTEMNSKLREYHG